MAEGSSLTLTIEKGPRAGETLTYSPRSLVKIGRVLRGNTIAIKDAGISSKHISIQFDTKWTLSDLDSSNGTFLNGQILKPHVPSALQDGDCIKIGELTSIIVKIEVDSAAPPRRNPRRQAKPAAVAASGPEPEPGHAVVMEKGVAELDLGFDGENEVKEPVQRRNLRSRGKKAVNLKDEVESLSCKRTLRSSKQKDVSLNVDAVEITDPPVPLEPRRTRGRNRLPVQPPVDPGLDEIKPADVVVPVEGRRTRGGRKKLQVEPPESAQSGGLEENVNSVKDSGIGEFASSQKDTNNEPVEEDVVEELVSSQKDCDGKEVGEELEDMKDGDNDRWDLEKMVLSDFFDYMEVELAKEIYDGSEKMISELEEKARRCHGYRLQRMEMERVK